MKKNLQLIICGHGALACALLKYRSDDPPHKAGISYELAGEPESYRAENEVFIGIHAGKSGKQLPEFIDWCEKRKIPLIQAATGMTLPKELKIPVIDAPNMAIEIIAFLKHLAAFTDGIIKSPGVEVSNISLVESHQESKGDSVPGTARKIADAAGLAHKRIVSVQNPDLQRLLGVPPANLDRHAYHRLEIEFKGGTRIGFDTKIHGLETYAKGAVFLAQRIIELKLQPGLHPMTELL